MPVHLSSFLKISNDSYWFKLEAAVMALVLVHTLLFPCQQAIRARNSSGPDRRVNDLQLCDQASYAREGAVRKQAGCWTFVEGPPRLGNNITHSLLSGPLSCKKNERGLRPIVAITFGCRLRSLNESGYLGSASI